MHNLNPDFQPEGAEKMVVHVMGAFITLTFPRPSAVLIAGDVDKHDRIF